MSGRNRGVWRVGMQEKEGNRTRVAAMEVTGVVEVIERMRVRQELRLEDSKIGVIKVSHKDA